MVNNMRKFYWKCKVALLNLILLIYYFHTVKTLLDVNGLRGVRLYRFMDWHDGQLYFIGFQDKTKVFIKVDLFTQCQVNEIIAYEILSSYLHKNLLMIYDFRQFKEASVLIMEFVHVTKENLLGCDNAKTIAVEMLKIVRTINELGVIHRDIREDNFLLGNDGELKLIDFTFCADLRMRERFTGPKAGSAFKIGLDRFLGGAERAGNDYWNDFASIYKVMQNNGLDANEIFRNSGLFDLDTLITKESNFSLLVEP